MNIHLAKANELKKIDTLIEVSTKQLQVEFYSPEIIEEALELVTEIKQMVLEHTLFVAENTGNIVACGGYRNIEKGLNAELKAFFVHPLHARQGLASKILVKCIEKLKAERVKELCLVATLAGEPFYRTQGFYESERKSITLSSGASFEVVNMHRSL